MSSQGRLARRGGNVGNRGSETTFSPHEMAENVLQQATESLHELLTDTQITEFDRCLFDYQHEHLRAEKPVCYTQQEWLAMDLRHRRILTSRLRLLGYQFDPLAYTWTKKFRTSLCDHLAGEQHARRP